MPVSKMRIPDEVRSRAEDWWEIDAEYALPSLSELKIEARRRVEMRWHDPDRKRKREFHIEVFNRLVGLIGERQVARHLRVPMRLGVKHHGDKRANLFTREGIGVDVHCRRLQDQQQTWVPDLLLNEHEVERPDLAMVLSVFLGTMYDPWVVGWIWETEVRELERMVSHAGEHQSFSYPPEKLRDLRTLPDMTPMDIPARQQVLL